MSSPGDSDTQDTRLVIQLVSFWCYMCDVALKGDVCHYIQCHHQFVLVTGETNFGEYNSYERYILFLFLQRTECCDYCSGIFSWGLIFVFFMIHSHPCIFNSWKFNLRILVLSWVGFEQYRSDNEIFDAQKSNIEQNTEI